MVVGRFSPDYPAIQASVCLQHQRLMHTFTQIRKIRRTPADFRYRCQIFERCSQLMRCRATYPLPEAQDFFD